MRRVDELSESMLLHYSSPNRELVTEILGFDAQQFGNLINDQLSKYILVLGQYLVMLQHNQNLKEIEHTLSLKNFEYLVAKDKILKEVPKNIKTEKDRLVWVVENNEELKDLYENLLASEAEQTLMSGMCKAVEGLLNALKKELSIRCSDD